MKLRAYHNSDFAALSTWITEARSHALWCANLLPYPLEEAAFEACLSKAGDQPFVATAEDGRIVGFFCFSANRAENEARMKFIVIDNTIRGRGYGAEMMRLAVGYAFEALGADTVSLNVFPENPGAKRCYEKAGFRERTMAEKAFSFQNECWGRCNMAVEKGAF